MCRKLLKELSTKFQQIKYITKLILHKIKIQDCKTQNLMGLDKLNNKDKNPLIITIDIQIQMK